MAETDLTSTQTDALEGTTDSDCEFVYHTLGDATYNVNGTRQAQRLLTMAKALGNRLRVYKDGTLTFGVRPGKILSGDSSLSYAGSTGNSLTDNATNYIYLSVVSGALALTANTTGFPDPSATPHLRLAQILTASAGYTYTDITDERQLSVFQLNSGATAANLNGLTDGSSASGLHVHPRSDLAEEALAVYRIGLQDVNSNAGDDLVSGNPTDSFEIVNGGWGTGTVILKGDVANSNTKTGTLCFEFPLPPEYVADADIKLAVHAKFDDSSGVTVGTKTLDAQAYKMADDGSSGSDLATSGAQTLTNSFADYAFPITDTGLDAGDKLLVYVRTVLQATDANDLWAEIGNLEIQLDIKG